MDYCYYFKIIVRSLRLCLNKAGSIEGLYRRKVCIHIDDYNDLKVKLFKNCCLFFPEKMQGNNGDLYE